MAWLALGAAPRAEDALREDAEAGRFAEASFKIELLFH